MKTNARIAAFAQHPMTTLRNMCVKLLAATRLRRLVQVKIHGGYKIHLHPAALSRAYYANPNERIRDFNVLRLILRPGDTYVDVGANIGTTVIPAAACVGSAGIVWAFEPHPTIARYLGENVQLNDLSNVRIHAVAVDRDRGSVWISNKNSDDQNDISPDGGADRVPVPAVRLDDVLTETTTIALLKIDVEGAEVRVLAGARRTLARTNVVYFEASERMLKRLGASVAELFVTLRAAGFDLFRFDGEHRLAPADPESVARADHLNLIAIKNKTAFAELTGLTVGSA